MSSGKDWKVSEVDGLDAELCAAIARIEEWVGCDMSATYRLARVDRRWAIDGVVVRRGGSAGEVWTSAQGGTHVAPWDPERPLRGHVNRFRRTLDLRAQNEDALWEVPVYARFYLPVGLTSDARMLVYDDDRFVCWIGLLRADRTRPFSTRQLRRLNAAAPSLVDDLVALDRRRRTAERGAPADLVFRPDGTLEGACDRGRAWIDAKRKTHLASVVRRADRHGMKHALVGGCALHVTRLEGPGGTRYLLNLRAVRRPRIAPDAGLSDRQREVARLAAHGATIDEIASHLSTHRETVRDHLRRVYRKLGVANRLELARVMSPAQS